MRNSCKHEKIEEGKLGGPGKVHKKDDLGIEVIVVGSQKDFVKNAAGASVVSFEPGSGGGGVKSKKVEDPKRGYRVEVFEEKVFFTKVTAYVGSEKEVVFNKVNSVVPIALRVIGKRREDGGSVIAQNFKNVEATRALAATIAKDFPGARIEKIGPAADNAQPGGIESSTREKPGKIVTGVMKSSVVFQANLGGNPTRRP